MSNPDPVPEAVLGDEYELMRLASQNVALLIKAFAEQPFENTADGYIHQLPEPVDRLPREKPLPQPKAQTRWQKFAAEKGIEKRRHDRMTYDEQAKKMVPRSWRKRNQDPIRDAKAGVDDFRGAEDPFSKEAKERKERLDKQAKNEVKNVEYNQRQARRAAAEAKQAQRRPGSKQRPKGGKK